MAVLTGEEEYIQDISSIDTAENTDGVISGCVNCGMVNGGWKLSGSRYSIWYSIRRHDTAGGLCCVFSDSSGCGNSNTCIFIYKKA